MMYISRICLDIVIWMVNINPETWSINTGGVRRLSLSQLANHSQNHNNHPHLWVSPPRRQRREIQKNTAMPFVTMSVIQKAVRNAQQRIPEGSTTNIWSKMVPSQTRKKHPQILSKTILKASLQMTLAVVILWWKTNQNQQMACLECLLEGNNIFLCSII